MIKLRKEPKLVKTTSCVPNSVSCLFDVASTELYEIFKTDSNGTHFGFAMRKLQEMTEHRIAVVSVGSDWSEAWWIEALSSKFPLLLSCTWKHKVCRMGRARTLHHAIAVVDGMVFDPAHDEPVPVDIFKEENGRDRELVIKDMALIER